MLSGAWPSPPWRPNSSRLLTTPSLLAPMSTRISSLSMRTTLPSTTSPCLKLLMSESCSASSSSIVVGSGPRSRGGATGSGSSSAAGASAVSAPSRPLAASVVGRGSGASTAAAGASAAASAVGASASLGGRAVRIGGGGRHVRGGVGVGDRRVIGVGAAGEPRRHGLGRPLGRLGRVRGRLGAVGRSLRRAIVGRRFGSRRLAAWRHRRRARGWRPRRPCSRLGPAGSSATATAPTGCSDAWVVTEAFASASGAVPPCCSSVNVVVTPGGGFAPENHERPERSLRP